jgi:hypothetical protein
MASTHHIFTTNSLKNKNEMGGACSTYWGEERCIQDFDGKPEG